MSDHEKMRTTLSELCKEFTSKVMEAIPGELEPESTEENISVDFELENLVTVPENPESHRSTGDCATT